MGMFRTRLEEYWYVIASGVVPLALNNNCRRKFCISSLISSKQPQGVPTCVTVH